MLLDDDYDIEIAGMNDTEKYQNRESLFESILQDVKVINEQDTSRNSRNSKKITEIDNLKKFNTEIMNELL